MLKGSRRRLARRLLQKQMLQAVPTADVIVTNPTHYAVALKYERGKDKAPVVLAKGENRFALRIKELAAEYGVPTVENKPVAACCSPWAGWGRRSRRALPGRGADPRRRLPHPPLLLPPPEGPPGRDGRLNPCPPAQTA
jgi:hypothetical protein